jgi:stress response protein YsnF
MAQEPTNWGGRMVVGVRGGKIGTLDALYCDEATGQPVWGVVNMGFAGGRSAFVPLSDARERGDDVRIGIPKRIVADAPWVEPADRLSANDEARLAAHYRLANRIGQHEADDAATADTAGPADDAMTRSEEQLHIHRDRRPRQVVRLKKRVVTEEQHLTVPVQREEFVLEREPIGEDTVRETLAETQPAATSEHSQNADEWMTLHEEKVEVTKRVVPKERVRLAKDITIEEQTLNEELRKERIDIEREPIDPNASV